jgi:hypothetical protein
MPFIKSDRRAEIERLGPVACKDVGDICYVFYRKMVHLWEQEPRWTTAHQIYKCFILDIDDNEFYWVTNNILVAKFGLLDVKAGCDLAWQIFVLHYVADYELLKEKENGTI